MGQTFGQRVKRIMEENNWKAWDLAIQVDCSDDAVRGWLEGRLPRQEMLERMAEKLGRNPVWLQFGAPHPERLGGSPCTPTEPSTRSIAERSYREAVVEHLIEVDGLPRDLVEDVVPSGAEMLSTSLDLCRDTLKAEVFARQCRDASGQPLTRTTSTLAEHNYGTVIGDWSEALIKASQKERL